MNRNNPETGTRREVGPWVIRVAYQEYVNEQTWGPFALGSDAEECVKILAARKEILGARIEHGER